MRDEDASERMRAEKKCMESAEAVRYINDEDVVCEAGEET